MLALVHRSLRNVTTCRPAYSLAGVAARCFSSDQETFITIDRSGLYEHKEHEHGTSPVANKEPETELSRHLKSIIRVRNFTLALYINIKSKI